jgi:hypothetical protein
MEYINYSQLREVRGVDNNIERERSINYFAPKPVAEGVAEARKLLTKDQVETLLPSDRMVTEVVCDGYQSETFRSAGYHMMPDRYGTTDRALVTVKFDDDASLFIVTGRVSSDNPYEVGHGAGGGIDLREKQTTVYVYDGHETITEYLPDGENNSYTGEYGTPDALLPHVESSLGTMVECQMYTPEQTH